LPAARKLVGCLEVHVVRADYVAFFNSPSIHKLLEAESKKPRQNLLLCFEHLGCPVPEWY